MTDEQRMREQFEKWEQTEAAAFLDDPDHCNYSVAEAVWLHAWLARDAEVQALREALAEVAEGLAFEIVDKHGPIQAHPDAARSFYRAMEPVYRARRLLGGGKTGETE